MTFKRTIMSSAIAAAVAAPAFAADDPFDIGRGGEYRAGDFHNHTSCSDGSTSVATLTRQAIDTYGHDWFIHVGHSGSGVRDCRVSDFLYTHRNNGGSSAGLWQNSIGPENIKGNNLGARQTTILSVAEDGTETEFEQRYLRMWRWQSLQEYNLPGIVEEREYPGREDKVAFLGLEWVVPGHEHSSNTLVDAQYDEEPNADALAQFEYCFARPSNDDSQGAGQGWTCELSEEANERLKAHFEAAALSGRAQPNQGNVDYNASLDPATGINTDDGGDHIKAVAATMWMEENYPGNGMAVQAHVERQGTFIEDDAEGWNVEHMRDMNDMAPTVAFGFESEPGHQAQYNRGSYNGGRPTAGGVTYGGVGAYAGAEVSMPGKDFEGNDLTPEFLDEWEGGLFEGENPEKVALGRPGIRTMWDALLSEGRHFWYFGSSDWHNRGSFGPTHFASTNDFWPGEFQDNFTYVIDRPDRDPSEDIVDALRSGNTYVVMGQLIDKLKFEACSGGTCATMGETLEVRPNALVRVTLMVNDPPGPNKAPKQYSFPNPIHKQLGIEVPVNEPELASVRLIQGAVTGKIPVSSPEYNNPMAPETTHIAQIWGPEDWGFSPVKRMTYVFRATEDGYIRADGSNVPPGVPNARDAEGNPLPDYMRDNIPCDDPLCPPHVFGVLTADLEAWSDVMFHTNPIFIDVQDPRFAAE